MAALALLRQALPVLAGAGAGFLAAFFAPALGAVPAGVPTAAGVKPASGAVEQAAVAVVPPQQGQVMARLARELEPVEAETATERAVEPPSRWRDMIASARAEPVHREWAARTEQAMLAELGTLGEQHGFSAQSARCGTAQCLFGLRFPNAITSEAFDAVLYHDFPVKCARSVVKRTPADGAQATEMELLLDCRAGEEP